MSSLASPPSTSPYSPSPLTASTSTSASERYSVSPLPSPGASFSRWKSAFRIGKSTNVDGRPVPDPSAYGRDGPLPDAAETPPASSSRPVRAAQTRSQTDPNPLTQATPAAGKIAPSPTIGLNLARRIRHPIITTPRPPRSLRRPPGSNPAPTPARPIPIAPLIPHRLDYKRRPHPKPLSLRMPTPMAAPPHRCILTVEVPHLKRRCDRRVWA